VPGSTGLQWREVAILPVWFRLRFPAPLGTGAHSYSCKIHGGSLDGKMGGQGNHQVTRATSVWCVIPVFVFGEGKSFPLILGQNWLPTQSQSKCCPVSDTKIPQTTQGGLRDRSLLAPEVPSEHTSAGKSGRGAVLPDQTRSSNPVDSPQHPAFSVNLSTRQP